MRVSFLVAGVQKAGTTALQAYLAEHPGLQMASVKEPHVFDDERGMNWDAPDYGPYHALFGPADGRPRGEATPIYLYWPPSLDRIARYNPAMRLVLLFRDPVGRAWSHWRMEMARGWESEPFGWCVREGRARVDDPAASGAHRVFSYVERGFYGAQLARAYALFPRKQVLCLRSDALKARPAETLDRICEFLGAGPFPAPPRPRELNVGAPSSESGPNDADERYLRALFAEDLHRFAALTGLPVEDWLP